MAHKRCKTRPELVIRLFSLLQKTEANTNVMRQVQFAQYCADLETIVTEMLQQVTSSPSTYGPHLELICSKLNRASEVIFVRFVKHYNMLAQTSKRCDDIGWNPASIFFTSLCKTRYLSEVCHTVSLVLYGRKDSSAINDTSWTRFDAEDPNAGITYTERLEEAIEADAAHASTKPKKRKHYGVELPVPFFPLNRSDAKRAFRTYTVCKDRRVLDDYRPKRLHWRPSDERRCSFISHAVYLFSPDIRIGQYTQWQVLLQLQRLAQLWHFLDPDNPTLYTLLSALLLRAAEIISCTFTDSEHVLDAPRMYREHAVWCGKTEPAESRSTSKKIVSRPDGSIGYEDSDEIRTLKKEIDTYNSTRKQASVHYVREVAGLFRGMYRELLFYKEHVAPHTRRVDVCKLHIQCALFDLIQTSINGKSVMLDRDIEQQSLRRRRFRKIRKRNKRRKERRRQHETNADTQPTAESDAMRVIRGVVKDAEMPDSVYLSEELASQESGEIVVQRASDKQIAVLTNVIRAILVRHASDMRDSTFIDSVVRRVGVDTVPHGFRELYASKNEGIMNSAAEAQEQTCFPHPILAHRRNMWPAVGLDYFLSGHFSPRVHSRVICAMFQNILYTMDSSYIWNDKEVPDRVLHGNFKPCVIYDVSSDLEHGLNITRDCVPRIYIIMNSFFIVENNAFFRVPAGNIYEAIVYWILLFARQKFTRALNSTMVNEWLALKHWIADIVKRNAETFLLAQFDT